MYQHVMSSTPSLRRTALAALALAGVLALAACSSTAEPTTGESGVDTTAASEAAAPAEPTAATEPANTEPAESDTSESNTTESNTADSDTANTEPAESDSESDTSESNTSGDSDYCASYADNQALFAGSGDVGFTEEFFEDQLARMEDTLDVAPAELSDDLHFAADQFREMAGVFAEFDYNPAAPGMAEALTRLINQEDLLRMEAISKRVEAYGSEVCGIDPIEPFAGAASAAVPAPPTMPIDPEIRADIAETITEAVEQNPVDPDLAECLLTDESLDALATGEMTGRYDIEVCGFTMIELAVTLGLT